MIEKIGYYFITDRKLTKKGILEDVEAACKAGAKIIQYRDKDVDGKELYNNAAKIKDICKQYNTIFLINDRVDIALAVDADGVHLGQDDLPYPIVRKLLGKKKIIGVSTHSFQEAYIASFSDVNYIAIGAIFKSDTKKDAQHNKGIDLIKMVKNQIETPIVAIGGIKFDNLDQVIDAGADGVCAISDIVKKDCVESEIKKWNSKFKEIKF